MSPPLEGTTEPLYQFGFNDIILIQLISNGKIGGVI